MSYYIQDAQTHCIWILYNYVVSEVEEEEEEEKRMSTTILLALLLKELPEVS